MRFKNLTPHALVLVLSDGQRLTVPPSGTVARVVSPSSQGYSSLQTEDSTHAPTIPVYLLPAEGEVVGLPPEAEAPCVCSNCGNAEDYGTCDVCGSSGFLPPGTHPPAEVYLVSGMVLAHVSVRGRVDVYAPGTGPNDGAIRNDKGQVEAVTRLLMAPR